MIIARVCPGRVVDTMVDLNQNLSSNRKSLINGFDSYFGNERQRP